MRAVSATEDPRTAEVTPRSVEALLAGIGEGFFALDPAWRFEEFNPAAEEIFGLTRAELLGRTIWEVSPGLGGTEFERRYRQAMERRERQEFEAAPPYRPDRLHQIRAFPFGAGIGVAVRDITRHVKAEQAARESEGRLRAIADALPLLISYIDAGEVFRFANRAYEGWFGRPLDQILGRSMQDVLTPEMYAWRHPYVARALAGETVSYEADFPHREGKRHTIITHVPHIDPSGEVLGLYAVVQDLTAHKIADKELAESEARFRAIADSAPVPIWVTRINGLRDFVNRAYMDFLGATFEQAVKYDWRNALHPDDLARILREQVAGERSQKAFTLEARYRRWDGEWRWLRSQSQPRWGPDGEHIGFIGVAHDVTASKQAEMRLAEANQSLETGIERRDQRIAATEGLIRTFFQYSLECHAILAEGEDGLFRYEEVNPATLRLYDKSRAEVIGRTLEEVLGAESGGFIESLLLACLSDGAPRSYERRQGGLLIEAITGAAPREPGGPRRAIVTARDVTARRQLEQQLRQAQKMEAVGQLTGGVAHDFNNMLTLVLGGLDMIGRQVLQLPPGPAAARLARGRELALQGVRRAASLTTRLLTFSRQQALAPRALDVNRLILGLRELLRRALGETMALELDLTPEPWGVLADQDQLESALLNLVLNARDAMTEGGRVNLVTRNVELGPEELAEFDEPIAEGPYLSICVSDTGAGMDAATLERAFDPFFTTKEVGKGTGLGLSQVYGFSRQSLGQTRIHSRPGEGSAITIYLPRHAGPIEAPTAARRDVAPPVSRGETVLLVEDDRLLRAFIAEMLEELGYVAVEADGAPAALAIVKSPGQIDLILTDIVMPGIDGAKLVEEARRIRPSLGYVFMTGYSADPRESLTKPFSVQDLAAKLHEALAEKR